MTFQDLLQWWNLIYVLPLLTSIVWIVATALSGAHVGGHGGHDGGDFGHAMHSVSHGIDHATHSVGHVLHHGSVDASHSHGGQMEHGHADHSDHAHAGHHEDNDFGARLLAIIGIGRVPITLLIGIFMLCWGAFGMVTNQFLANTMKYPLLYIWPSMGVTFGVSVVFTRIAAALLGKIMPQTETFGVSRLELVGSLGKTIYLIGEDKGTIDIQDVHGTVHRVQAKTPPGEDTIPSGTEVIVIDFDEKDNRFIVRISNL